MAVSDTGTDMKQRLAVLEASVNSDGLFQLFFGLFLFYTGVLLRVYCWSVSKDEVSKSDIQRLIGHNSNRLSFLECKVTSHCLMRDCDKMPQCVWEEAERQLYASNRH